MLSRSNHVAGLAALAARQLNDIVFLHLTDDIDHASNGEQRLIETLASSSDCFVDVGANAGTWSRLFLNAMGREPRCGLLFEPRPVSAATLRAELADVCGVEVVERGLADTVGSAPFYEAGGNGALSSFVASWPPSPLAGRGVQLSTLDMELAARGIDHVDIVKIDAEGLDLHVLRGASSFLARQRADVVQFEYNEPWRRVGSTLAEAFGFLDARGYKTFLLKREGLHELRYRLFREYYHHSNFVAVSPVGLGRVRSMLAGPV